MEVTAAAGGVSEQRQRTVSAVSLTSTTISVRRVRQDYTESDESPL